MQKAPEGRRNGVTGTLCIGSRYGGATTALAAVVHRLCWRRQTATRIRCARRDTTPVDPPCGVPRESLIFCCLQIDRLGLRPLRAKTLRRRWGGRPCGVTTGQHCPNTLGRHVGVSAAKPPAAVSCLPFWGARCLGRRGVQAAPPVVRCLSVACTPYGVQPFALIPTRYAARCFRFGFRFATLQAHGRQNPAKTMHSSSHRTVNRAARRTHPASDS